MPSKGAPVGAAELIASGLYLVCTGHGVSAHYDRDEGHGRTANQILTAYACVASREERGPARQWQSSWTVQRSAEEVRASIYSLPSAAPHLFAFDTLLRDLLNNTAANGMFNERLRGITADIWR